VSREPLIVFLKLINLSCEPETNRALFDIELTAFFVLPSLGRSAALPQVILAQWYDLYDNANRAEYRGIGIYGNRSVAPGIDADEFAAALSRVVGPGPEAERYKNRALEISGLCKAAGGRKAAVDRILELTTQHQ
jgi:UDP:flavonoid glycosyltransferase YjiC (YdhE family)